MITIQCGPANGVDIRFILQEDPHPLLNFAQSHSNFTGKLGDLFYYPSLEGPGSLLVGLEKEGDLDREDFRDLGYAIAMTLRQAKVAQAHLDLPARGNLDAQAVFLSLAEGALQANYRHTYKTQPEPDQEDLVIHMACPDADVKAWEEALSQLEVVLEGVFLARDLVNARANDLTPSTLASKAQDLLGGLGVEVEILQEDQIADLGMEAFLHVAKGSDQPPRLIRMAYQGDPDRQETTALVGKGLTYDSGGYCLKPASGMATMHSDMAGAATVIGSLYALAKTKAKTNVLGVVAACENLISGKAYKTGDVIGSLAGKTIEVANTDAEGRLTLADAITYASRQAGVTRVIDLATLTGACLIALGEEYTGALTNDMDFFRRLEDAAKLHGEPVWLLPTNDRLKKMNESKVADLTNSPGRLAGTITAGLFVGEFLAQKDMPWVHLDIAGSSYFSKARSYLPEGATGVHVKTLYELLKA